MYSFKQAGQRYLVSIKSKSELMHELFQFCADQNIVCGSLLGIGAVNSATLRFYNPVSKKYADKTFTEQMEIANLTGNISTKEGEIYLHVHAVLGRADYSALAGHLLAATINGACEVELHQSEGPAKRLFDAELGLNIYDF